MTSWVPGAHIVLDIAAISLVLLAGILSLAAGVGLLRLPDTMQRLHAGAKPQVLGVIVICVALMLRAPSLSVLGLGSLVIVFQMLTQPIAAHMAARTSYRQDAYVPELMTHDEMADDVLRAERRTQH